MAGEQKPVEKTEEQRQADARAVAESARAATAAAAASTSTESLQQKPQRPEGVPEKFFNAETGAIDYKAWGAAHASLETEFHKAKQPKDGEQKPTDAPVTTDSRKAAVDAASAEFAKDGKLSDATYATLDKQGYTRDMVDSYIDGRSAKATATESAAHEVAGGADKYAAMVGWAADNLDESEIIAYNAQINSKNPEVVKKATKGLLERYSKEAPKEGNRVGGTPPASGAGVFNSKHEMTTAINDPRYQRDAAYRAEVSKKIQASRRAGINIFN